MTAEASGDTVEWPEGAALLGDPVRGESTADIVARRISQAIMNGSLAPGTRLREAALAEAQGVSRTPIREALIQLNSIGLVELTRNRGATVLQLSPQDIVDVYGVRGLLEAEAARLAAGRMTPVLADLLDKSCDRLGELHHAPPAEQLAADTHFHYNIADASGNPRLSALIRQISSIPEAYRSVIAYRSEDMRAAEEQHRAVAAALRRRSAVEAAGRMREHVEWAGCLALDRLRERLAP